MALPKKAPAFSEENRPVCLIESDSSRLSLAIDFTLRDGRVHGFLDGHLLSYLYEKNPEATLHPDVPPDRFSFWFPTHDVLLTGWRLSGLAPLLREGKLASVVAVDPRYQGLAGTGPFVADIHVRRP